MENTKVDATVDKSKMTSFRCLIAYWILGLCNNYGYVVMLTAANDIIKEYSTSTEEKNYERNCTYLSTGAILLADVLPALLIKALAPFIPFFVHIRVAICVLISAGGFLLVAFSLGEVTFLQYSSFYHKNVVSTWSSGTGGAGVIGAISYSLLHYIGMRLALKIMIIIPIIMGLTFWILLPKPFGENILEVQKEVNTLELKSPREAIKYKLKLIPGLLKYIIPFSLVYLFEYFINQGTFELIDFRNSFVDQNEQYRWLQVSYQVGVLISRSSVNCVHIRHIWILSVLQLINVIIYTTEVIYFYIPNFIIMIVLTIWEGLLGGSAYVNTYYTISSEVNEKDKQFSLAITGFGDSIGITLAGVLSMIVHNKICDLPVPENIP
ncbi:battenin-like isoform X2 [Aethina tumida]|uniref:battenin-like isoform X2 n=1 Tax=Aethina tumida TaxID=116153 RepID=UPI002148F154|nr:battenin-like isoform X2 [Aethina tumida]